MRGGPPRSAPFPYAPRFRSDEAARGIDRRVADRGRAGGGRGRRRLVADGDRDRVRVGARMIRRALLRVGGVALDPYDPPRQLEDPTPSPPPTPPLIAPPLLT